MAQEDFSDKFSNINFTDIKVMEKIIKLSPYGIYWVELVPIKGIVTKHDRGLFGDAFQRGTEKKHYKHFSSKQRALDWLANFDATMLDKSYECRLFTDKQFGMTKAEDNFAIPFTSKQLKEVYYLKNTK